MYSYKQVHKSTSGGYKENNNKSRVTHRRAYFLFNIEKTSFIWRMLNSLYMFLFLLLLLLSLLYRRWMESNRHHCNYRSLECVCVWRSRLPSTGCWRCLCSYMLHSVGICSQSTLRTARDDVCDDGFFESAMLFVEMVSTHS